jgi:endonuclease/exonuclease/phosphatase family metal-dependent hydrolase
MQLKTVTWNVGGGKHLKDGEDPLLMVSYSVDAVIQIAEWLTSVNPDIVTLQEVQGDKNSNQVVEIARLMGYEYSFFDATSSSHIDEDKTLGNGIISKHPIADHSTGLFLNPGITSTIQGRHAVSHDKGYGICNINVHGQNISVATLHLLPFRAFGIDLESEKGKAILESVESAFSSSFSKALVQGDFNIDSDMLSNILPSLFKNDFDEIHLELPTTPSGRRYDHVLFKGLKLIDLRIDSSVKTDHYPVTCNFVIS